MSALFGLLGWRYVLGKKGRSFMTFLGIALGVTMIVAVLLTNNAITASYRDMLDTTAGRADLQISGTTGSGFPESVLREVVDTPDVKAAAPVVTTGAPITFAAKQVTATLYGTDPATDRAVRDYKELTGRMPSGQERALAVSDDLAQRLGLNLNDRVQVLTTKGMAEFTVVGRFSTKGTTRGSLGPFAVVPLQTAQTIFGKEGKLDLIDLLVAHGRDVGQVRDRLASRLGASVRVGTPMERSKDMQGMLDSVIFVLTMAGSISLFAGAFIIYTNVAMGVTERRRDLSIMRALGMRRREVMGLVLFEAAALGLIGSLFGLGLGYAFASVFAKEMTQQFLTAYGLQMANVTMTATAVATAVVVGLGTSTVAAFGPARETIGLSPVEAMRPGELHGRDGGGAGWPRAVVGLTLIGAGVAVIALTWPTGMLSKPVLGLWGAMQVLMLFGFVLLLPTMLQWVTRWVFRPVLTALLGITGHLAAENLVRQPRRTAATICSLVVTLTFMVGIGGVGASQRAAFDSWYQKVVAWDLNVSTSWSGLSALVDMDPELEAKLAGVEGVRLVSPQKFTSIQLSDGQPAFLQVYDHNRLRQYSRTDLQEGDWSTAIEQMEAGGAIFISPAVAKRLGVAVNQHIDLPTPEGNRPFRVVGIMTDVTPYGGSVQIDRKDYVRMWKDEKSTNMALLVKPGHSAADVKGRIMKQFGDQLHLTIQLNREYWAVIAQQIDAFYQMMDGLVWISVIVSGMAIANTLFASLLERRREFGLMRAVGTRRGEVMRVIVGEALSTGMVGGVAGVLAGLALQFLLVSSSESITGASSVWQISWGSIGTACLVALVVAPLVGALPARMAARMDVVEALRYE